MSAFAPAARAANGTSLATSVSQILRCTFLGMFASACTTGPHASEPSAAPIVVAPVLAVAPLPPPPPPPDLAVSTLGAAADPTCVLSASDVELPRAIPLRFEDSAPFFRVGAAHVLEVRLASPRSTARASRTDMDIIGHVAPSDVPVRLRSNALVDGYLRVNHASLQDGDPARLAIVVEPPWFVKPAKDPVVVVRCDEIAVASATPRADASREDRSVMLRRGTSIALRAAPSGPVVATLQLPNVGPDEPEPEVREIERRGEQVHILIEWDQADVEGWVARRDVAPRGQTAAFGLLGALASAGSEIALVADAPLLVHAAGRVVRVGTARPGSFACVVPPNADAREVQLDSDGPFGPFALGDPSSGPGAGREPPAAKLFVAPARHEPCRATAPPARR